MILSVLLSVSFTFNVTATGVEKGTAVEFLVAGKNTDRDYESMFVLDEPVDSFCRRIDSAVPLGTPVDVASCRLWPTGCRVRFEPSFDRFVNSDIPEKERSVPIYTGGTRLSEGKLEAASVMPASVFSTYSLSQSPIVFNDPLDQGSAYGRFTAAVKLEKGAKYTFTLIVDEKSLPKKLDLTAEKGNLKILLQTLQETSRAGDVDACVSFSDNLTIEEATSVARALSVVDSSRVKINGSRGRLFYRSFLPLEKWRDRKERLQQPFELTLNDDGSDELLFIDEDWTVPGDDPKLTPRKITFSQAKDHAQTDTCFVFLSNTQTVSAVSRAMTRMESFRIRNWYVFPRH